MTIHLPKELESSVREAVSSGHFASEDALIAEAVRLLLRDRKDREPVSPSPAADSGLGSIGAMKDAADELDEIVADAMRKRRTETWRDLSFE